MASASVKKISSVLTTPLEGLVLVMCATGQDSFFASLAYLFHTHRLFPTSRDSPNMVPTSLLIGMSIAYPLSFGTFRHCRGTVFGYGA